MIENLRFHYNRGPIITYYKDGMERDIPYSAVKKAWPDLRRTEIEGYRIKTFGDLIAFVVVVAQGQGGCLFVWDTNRDELIHYSDASYCEDFLLCGSLVIMLFFVTNYVTPYHIQLWKCDFGTKDARECGKRVYCKKPVSFEDSSSSAGDKLFLRLKGKELEVVVNNTAYQYIDDVDNLGNQGPNPDYDYLYKRYENQFDPRKVAMRGMIT